MARPRKAMPDYRHHISGQAVVTLDGRDYYLGQHGSPESQARYLELLQVYTQHGKRMPSELPQQLRDSPITVRSLTAEFRDYTRTKYQNSPSWGRYYRNLCTLLEDEYGSLPAEQFGPRKLAELRDLLVASGNSRRYVNEQVRGIVAVFKYGVSRELVTPERIVALDSLEPLRYGQTTAPESKEVEPVDIETVRRTAVHLSPTIRAMVRIQAATGMRPSEVCAMRPCDVERRDDGIWIYRPVKHKTKHKKKLKAVPIAGDARAALEPFLDRDADEFCFSPAESLQWYRDQRTAARKTPLSCGDRVGTKCKANPKRRPGKQFNKDSYRRAIQRAAEKAGVEHWYPYQLRHLAGTVIRDALGVEAAQAVLGHSRAAMTEHYARLSLEKAIEATKAAPSIGQVPDAQQ